MIVGALTCCALLLSLCDLKAAQMNEQCSLIQILMLYKFKMGHNSAKATKSIYYAKDEGAFDHCIITKWFKKFHSGCKNLNDQAGSGRPKTMNSEITFQAIEGNPAERIRWAWYLKVQCGLSPSQSQQENSVAKLWLMLAK